VASQPSYGLLQINKTLPMGTAMKILALLTAAEDADDDLVDADRSGADSPVQRVHYRKTKA
jgi:hypothetical protein